MNWFLTILLFLCWGTSICAGQDLSFYLFENAPLKTVIQQLERETDLSFSYAEDIIRNKRITLKGERISIVELLAILEAQTGLEFRQLEEQQVVIVPISILNEVCAFLLDKETYLPIAYTSVTIDNILVVETDRRGFFRYKSSGKPAYQLVIEGYGPTDLIPAENCLPLYLSPLYSELDEVVVTAYITTGIDRNSDGSITLNHKPLGLLPGLTSPDILQGIQLIPGITSPDESAAGIQIHGGTSDQNLVLFDKIELYNTGYLYGMLSSFNPYATQKATIFKTSASPAYGDRISGVIDISSDDRIVERTNGGVGIDGLSLDGFIKIPLTRKSSTFLYTRRSYSDLYKSPTYDGYARKIFSNTGTIKDSNGNELNVETDDEYTYETSNNDFKFYDVNAKYIYQPSLKEKITVSTLMTRNHTDFSFTSGGEAKKDSLSTGNFGASFNWMHHSSPNQAEEITIYYSSFDSFYRNEEFIDQNREETNIRANKIRNFGLDIQSDRRLKNGNRLKAGYQVSHTNLKIDLSKTTNEAIEGDINLPEKQTNLKNALFGEYIVQKDNASLLSMGLRIAHYTGLGQVYLEPRVNMELPISDAIRLKAGLERRNQPISQLIEFNQTELRLENNLWSLSDGLNNPLLQSNQISGGLLVNKKGWTLDWEGYYKRLTGLTTYTQGFSLLQPNLSEGKSSIAGTDLLLKKRINNYRFWIGYSYNNIRFSFKEIQTGSFPGNNDITHSFRFSNALKLFNFQIALGWQYRTGLPVTPINNYNEQSRAVNFGRINSDRLPGFHRMDASLTYQFNLKKNSQMQFGFSALNIYNRIVPLSIIYRTKEENNTLQLEQVIHRYSLGFTPNLSFSLFF